VLRSFLFCHVKAACSLQITFSHHTQPTERHCSSKAPILVIIDYKLGHTGAAAAAVLGGVTDLSKVSGFKRQLTGLVLPVEVTDTAAER
jgi:hypothetical protein